MKRLLFLLLLLPLFSHAQIITTIAGCGIGDDSLATKAELVGPYDMALDASGNMYIADGGNSRIRKISASGIITTIAGTGVPGDSGDGGAATMAEVSSVQGIAVDKNGNVYFSETFSYRVRKVDTSGIITTIAGTGVSGESGDGGPATAAEMVPWGIITDSSGNIYIASRDDIRKINTSGVISTIAGNGTPGYSGDGGPATAAQLYFPRKMIFDKRGNLYIADEDNYVIRKVDTLGVISTIAGIYAIYGVSGDGGPATAARLGDILGITTDTSGNIFLSDDHYQRIREIDGVTGIINTIAGNGVAGFSGDGGPASAAQLNWPEGIITDISGNIYIADLYNNKLRKINHADSTITTIAGQNELFGEGYNALNAEMTTPDNVAVDATGNVYIPDLNNNRIRKVSTSGIITTVAGKGIAGMSGDSGPADSADLFYPAAVAVDAAGNLYIADADNNRIRKVNTSGIINTIAGNGTAGYSGDGGPATFAEINNPGGVAVDAAGNVYIADGENFRIRKINTAGAITTVAGTGTFGYNGDGGAATMAEIIPGDVAVDATGNIYIADGSNYRIRKVDTTGIITTIAGTGVAGFSGDGSMATSAEIDGSGGIKVDNAGNIYFSDFSNRIRMISNTGIINTIAGNGIAGFTGDGGMATNAEISGPGGVAVDLSGNMYIADGYNYRIRKVNLSYLSVPAINKTNSGNIVIYPNPASTQLTILSTNQPINQIAISNLLGQTMYSNQYNAPQVQVDVTAFAPGIYFVKVNGVEVRKFVKE